MNMPRGWRISDGVNHDMGPAVFAWTFAARKAKSLGLKWKVKVGVWHSKRCGCWRGRAFRNKPGIGRILCKLNGSLKPSEFMDWRFKGQPSYTFWNSQEIICFLFAHEFGHIIGYDGDKAGEMACNKFGYEAVKAWRCQQYEHPACLI